MGIHLNNDNLKVIVKPDQQTYILTGYTWYTFLGSGDTTVTVTGSVNNKIVTIYSSSSGITSVNWGDILGSISGQTDLWNILSGMTIDIQNNAICCSGNTLLISGNTLAIQALSATTSGGTIYNLSSPAAVTVGGITVGTVLTGKTSNELLEEILVPVLYPAFTNPSGTMTKTAPAATYYEIAEIITLVFEQDFNRGTIIPAYGTNGFRSDVPDNYYYNPAPLPLVVPSNAMSDAQSIVNHVVIQGVETWNGHIHFQIGQQPKDSKGNNYDSPYPAGNTSVKYVSIEGVYPLYATTVAIATLTKQALVSMINANNIVLSVVDETGGNKQKFEIPDAWLSSRPLTAIMTFNTLNLNWEYQGGTAATSLTYWTTSADIQTIQGNAINYSKYTYNGPDRSAVQIKLIF